MPSKTRLVCFDSDHSGCWNFTHCAAEDSLWRC